MSIFINFHTLSLQTYCQNTSIKSRQKNQTSLGLFICISLIIIVRYMYVGKSAAKLAQQKLKKKKQAARAQIEKNAAIVKETYQNFQANLNQFAKRYKNQIKSDPKFREKFNDMCQEFDVNPMLSQKNIWAQLGFGDFYHNLAMIVLDICAKNRHQNGGIMRIDDILMAYHRKEKNSITRNDVVKAMEKTYVLGNASIIDGNYVCTVPLQLNANLSLLLELATKYGFISAKLLAKEKKWSKEDFQHNIRDLRVKGILWIDKNVPQNPHFYFLSHLGTDFTKFIQFMREY